MYIEVENELNIATSEGCWIVCGDEKRVWTGQLPTRVPTTTPTASYLEHFDLSHDRDTHAFITFARLALDQLEGDEASVAAAVSRCRPRVARLGSRAVECLALPCKGDARECSFTERALDDKLPETVAVLQLRRCVLFFLTLR